MKNKRNRSPLLSPLQRLGRRHYLVGAFFFVVAGYLTYHFVFSHAAGTVYSVPSTIASNCSTAVDSQLNSFIASVPDGSSGAPNVIQFAANGCYLIANSLALVSRNWVTIDGQGSATIQWQNGAGSGHDPIIQFRGSGGTTTGGSHVAVQNIKLLGDNQDTASQFSSGCPATSAVSDWEWMHGVSFSGTNYGTVNNVTINNVCGDFVEANALGNSGNYCYSCDTNLYWTPAQNITVENSSFSGSGRMGFGWTDFVNSTIANNSINRVNMAGVDVELDDNGEFGQNLTISGNTFSNIRFSLLANAGSGSYPNIQNINFIGNKQLNPGTCQPPVNSTLASSTSYRQGFNIQNNNLIAWGAAFSLTSVRDVQISGNTVTQQPGGGCGATAVLLDSVQNANVGGNSWPNFGQNYSTATTYSANSGIVACSNKLGSSTSYNSPTVCPAPAVSFASPASGSTVSGTVGVATNASSAAGIRQVAYYVDGASTPAATVSAAPYGFSWNTGGLSGGNHTIKAVATDSVSSDPTGSTSLTVNVSPTATPTFTPTPSPSSTPSSTPSPSPSASASPSPTATTSPTAAQSVSITTPSAGATVSGVMDVWAAAQASAGVKQVSFYVDGANTAVIASPQIAPNHYGFTWNTANWSNGSHTLTAQVVDNNNQALASAPVSVNIANNAGDTTPPSAPAGLQATAVSTSQVNISWGASTDNVGVTGYHLYRNGSLLANVAATSYSDTAVSSSTSYSYYVTAYDAAGNTSGASNTVSVTTPAPTDTTPPTTPVLSASVVSSSQIRLSWSAASDSGSGLAGYYLYRGSAVIAQLGAGTTSYTDSGLSAGTTYSYFVRAYDNAGNLSAPSNTVSPTIPATTTDTTPPAAVTGLVISFVSNRQVNLSWSASSDNVGVAGYRIYRSDGAQYVSTTTSFGDGNVLPNRTYSYTVRAYDAAGNLSPASATVSAYTHK